MIVPIRVDGAKNEWCIVEFQGQMIPNEGEDMANVEIGSLWYDDGVPTMRVGNHIVTGKVSKLPKPFAILEKLALTCNDTTDAAMPAASEGDDDEQSASDGGASQSTDASNTPSQTEYNIVGIARSRVIFNARPKPILV
ncbi:hypothetical protein PINS_up009963 [Pythium insidiosum]|nr:hypothetical protein PINS_up009963 [Pythium insidiosum]